MPKEIMTPTELASHLRDGASAFSEKPPTQKSPNYRLKFLAHGITVEVWEKDDGTVTVGFFAHCDTNVMIGRWMELQELFDRP